MLPVRQRVKFLVFVLGSLIILLGLLSCVIVRGESRLLALSAAALLALIGGTLYLLILIFRKAQDRAVRLSLYNRDLATISRLSTKIYNSQLSRDELLDRFMRGVTRGLDFPRAMLCLVDVVSVAGAGAANRNRIPAGVPGSTQTPTNPTP